MNLSLTGLSFAIIALVAGVLVPFQAASNAELGRALGHPLWATVMSLFISVLIAIPVILAVRVPMPILNQLGQLSIWSHEFTNQRDTCWAFGWCRFRSTRYDYGSMAYRFVYRSKQC